MLLAKLKTTNLPDSMQNDILVASKNWSPEILDKVAKDDFDFCELHVHSNYSLLDGVSDIKELVETAKSLGHRAMAVTNHGVTSDLPQFKGLEVPEGFKKIMGCEVYLIDESEETKQTAHLLCLAKNETGYKNLLHLVSHAFLHGVNVHGHAHIPVKDLEDFDLTGIIASSACIGGVLGNIYQKQIQSETFSPDVTLNKMVESARYWSSKFEDYYLEVQNYEAVNAEEYAQLREDEINFINLQKEYNEYLYKVAKTLNLKVIATNDVHYARKEQARIQDIMLCINTKSVLKDPNRFRFSCQKHYMKSKWEMLWAFRDHPEVVMETQNVADLVNIPEKKHEYYLPLYPLANSKEEQISLFHELVSKGLRAFYGKPENLRPLIEKFGSREAALKTIAERSEYEKSVLLNMGFEGYVMLVAWCIQIAKENNVLVGHGRGSCAGSIVALALNITDLCPLRYDLIFERFLNPDRIEMPDIDVDYQYEHRLKVIDLIKEKLGEDKMAQIVTFGKLKGRSAIRDAGRVLGISLPVVDKIAKQIPAGKKIGEAIESSKELQNEIANNSAIAELLDVAKQIEGKNKNYSVHAAGVILSSEPIQNVVAVQSGKRAVLPVIQSEMGNVDKLGLVKQDFLGLRTLSVIAECLRLVKERQGIDLKYEDIPKEDPETFAMLARGESIACFQLESAGMRQLMREIEIARVEDVIDCIALYRPGVLKVGMHKDYVRNKNNPDKIAYLHPSMESILSSTRGILIYQEEAMQLANKLAGFSMALSDTLRKAIGKKKEDLMAKLKVQFIDGCYKTTNIPKETAEKIWELIDVMSGYSFNKSHSAAYAMTSIDTAYLKCHFPVEFMCAAISKAAEGKSPKLPLYIEEAKRMGIKVLPPDINKSDVWFSISDNGEIVFGLQAIKDVGKCCDDIIAEREANGPFKDIVDFRKRCQTANKSALRSLIRVGAFDGIDKNRNVLLSVLEEVLKIKPKKSKTGEIKFADSYNIIYPDLDAPTVNEISVEELELCSIYITAHPFSQYLPIVEENIARGGSNLRVEDFHSGTIEDNTSVFFGGFVKECRITTTKKGDSMAILKLDDISETVDAVMFPGVYSKFADILEEGSSYMISGKLQYKENFVSKKNEDSADDDIDNAGADEIPQIVIFEIKPFPETVHGYIPYDLWANGREVEVI